MAGESSSGYPPFSRLFIIGDKNATDADYRETFSKLDLGEIVTISFIKDRKGEAKGLVYIQMKKTSAACKAVETLNGVCVGSTSRSIKVLIATNRSDTTSDDDIIAQVSRLFVVVPKTHNESDIEQEFQQYGAIRKVVTIKDRKTSLSKGLAFVTFQKASDAATAYENCSSDYKPKFADPITKLKRQHDDGDDMRSYDRHGGDRYSGESRHGGDYRYMQSNQRNPGFSVPDIKASPNMNKGPAEFLANFPHTNQFYLKVRVPKGLTQHQLTRLFNIVPTLEFCRLSTNQFSTTDIAIVGFSSASCCTYAKEALHGFEYPPGCPLDVEYYDNNNAGADQIAPPPPPQSINPAGSVNYQANAAPSGGYDDNRYNGTSASPGVQLMPDSDTKKRLFIVSQPERISTRVLSEMFCRFGNFISVNYIPGKNYGFAKFANEGSADNAQRYMHGESVGGNHLKCLDAEDPPPEHKKSRT